LRSLATTVFVAPAAVAGRTPDDLELRRWPGPCVPAWDAERRPRRGRGGDPSVPQRSWDVRRVVGRPPSEWAQPDPDLEWSTPWPDLAKILIRQKLRGAWFRETRGGPASPDGN
jgi:hypothetical protein